MENYQVIQMSWVYTKAYLTVIFQAPIQSILIGDATAESCSIIFRWN